MPNAWISSSVYWCSCLHSEHTRRTSRCATIRLTALATLNGSIPMSIMRVTVDGASFLRQDPNIIMVGEIRDLETGSIAIKAALTGHLVLATLHTNDAPSTVTRMIDMGIEPLSVASAVNLIVAQRLVRRVCSECKQEHTYTAEEIHALGIPLAEAKHLTFF